MIPSAAVSVQYHCSRWKQYNYFWLCGWTRRPHSPLRSNLLGKADIHMSSIQQPPDDQIITTMCDVQNVFHLLSFRHCLVNELLRLLRRMFDFTRGSWWISPNLKVGQESEERCSHSWWSARFGSDLATSVLLLRMHPRQTVRPCKNGW